MNYRYILLAVYFLISPLARTLAQKNFIKNTIKHEKISVSSSLGLSSYYGDLCDAYACMQFRINAGLGFQYRFTNHISGKLEVNYYRLHSNDVWKDRNLGFRSGNVESYVAGVFDYFPWTKHFRKRKFINPYAFVGLGLTYFNPKGKLPGSKWEALRPLKTEGQIVPYPSVAGIIPFGIGFKIKATKYLDITLEGGYRITFTDHLDDVSSYYYADTALMTNPKSKEYSIRAINGGNDAYKPNLGPNYGSQGSQRGNPKKNDGYFIFKVGVRYTLNPKTKFLFKKHQSVAHPHVK